MSSNPNTTFLEDFKAATIENLQTLKNSKSLTNVHFLVHNPSLDTPQSFYGLKILFAAYSHVFDDLLYDDENHIPSVNDENNENVDVSNVNITQFGLDFDEGEERKHSSIKTVHLHNIHPKAFDYLYDVFLGATHELPIDEFFAGKH